MNPNKFLMGLFGAFALSACTSEDPANINSGTTEQTTADAYIVVNIVSNDTRAGEEEESTGTSTSNSEYSYAVGNEGTVTDAQFFFFDANGIYVGKHQRWDGGDTGSTPNVEYIGKNVILLNNQGTNDYPKYLLTVLNDPNFDIPANSNLEAVSKMLRNWENDSHYFVMSTSSFLKESSTTSNDENSKNYYYVTELTSEDFSLYDPNEGSPVINETTKVVEIYVERLAAKVQLTFGDSNNYVEKVDNDFIFKTDVAIMGKANTGEEFDNENELGVASTPVYVKVSGWDLSATANNSYLSKQLNENWITDGPWTGWQNPSYYRSFWAMSPGYYPGTPDLNYKTYNNLKIPVINTADKNEPENNVSYCNENTNLPDYILKSGQPDASMITHALIKAELCIKDGDTYTGIDAVKYNGVLFTYDRYKDYLLDKINKGDGSLNLWIKTSEVELDNATVTDFKQIDNSYVTFKLVSEVKANGSGLDGIFTADYKSGTGKVLAIANIPENAVLYSRTKVDESYEYTEISDPASALNTSLASAQDESVEAYNGGAMYYTIPIEHETTAVTSNDKEGYYGVVRNHWYNISVENIIRVGHGVFRPEYDSETNEDPEPIIPDDPEDPRYYVAARINILSWKLVKQQNVTL